MKNTSALYKQVRILISYIVIIIYFQPGTSASNVYKLYYSKLMMCCFSLHVIGRKTLLQQVASMFRDENINEPPKNTERSCSEALTCQSAE